MADSFGSRPRQTVLPLKDCTDLQLAGGKAVGLGRLIMSGFPVPPGLCVTIPACRESLRAGGFDDAARWARVCRAADEPRQAMLEEDRRLVTSLSLSRSLLARIDEALDRLGLGREMTFAVRSSASDEDGATATFAGLYRTRLGVPRDALAPAILDCWASLWTDAALAYRLRVGGRSAVPAMAVIIQAMLAPRVAGVAYSRHPVTGDPQQVLINAVFGLAEPLVAGTVTPDQYVVDVGVGVGAGTDSGKVIEQRLAEPDREAPVLDEREILALAGLVKDVERQVGFPADIEWAMDSHGTWLLQARPIPTPRPASAPPRIVWSRANFKETLPDVPSPLGLSFLETFMDTNIVSHYRELGCRIPDGWSAVRIMRGRPYINVSLFQSFTMQLGGDPRLVVEQMGGEEPLPIEGPPRRPWWRMLRAGLLMERNIRRAAKQAPAWFAEMKRMAEDRPDEERAGQPPADLLARLDRLNQRLREADLTFAIVAGVSQGLYALGRLLPRRLGPDWRPLLNEALQGIGTIISAQQIVWLTDLADEARQEPMAREFFLAEPWEPFSFRSKLAGTNFLRGFEAYLAEYGHRAVGESDPMAARFAELPDYLLGVIRGHLHAPSARLGRSADAIRREQETARINALETIRLAFGWRRHEWLLFRYTYTRLCRFLALREANRHHLMHFTAAARQGEVQLGAAFVALGLLRSREDIFFLTADEIRAAVDGRRKDWKDLVATRQAERAQHALLEAPDTVIDGERAALQEAAPHGETLTGIPISSGYAAGPARIIRSPDDLKKVQRGDILVVPVIDPGMAPVLGLAAGLVVEMGGTLSHGAIIVREYGLPAVANVRLAGRCLQDGDWVAVDASRGAVRPLGKSRGQA